MRNSIPLDLPDLIIGSAIITKSIIKTFECEVGGKSSIQVWYGKFGSYQKDETSIILIKVDIHMTIITHAKKQPFYLTPPPRQ